LKEITPPLGKPTQYYYPSNNAYKRVFRSDSNNYSSGYYIDHNYDGFGRAIGTADKKGITTSIVYKSYGVKDYADSNVATEQFMTFLDG